MKTRRYTTQDGEELAARLVAVAETEGIEEEAKPAKMKCVNEARRALLHLMEAPFGEVAIAPAVIARLRVADGGTVYSFTTDVRDILRANHPGGDESRSMTPGFRVMKIRIMAVPTRGGYRFELGQGGDDMAAIASMQSLVRLQVLRLIQFIGRDRFRQCDCGRVFVRRGRREYCSDRCQKRIYMRKFRGSRVTTTRKE